MNVQSEIDGKSQRTWLRVLVVGVLVSAALLVIIAIAFAAGAAWGSQMTSQPSHEQQVAEVAALQTHVLPVVEDLAATWYLDTALSERSITWKRGKFTTDPARGLEDGSQLFDDETETAFGQVKQAIRSSGVRVERLVDAKYRPDGTLRYASFYREGGGITYVFTYIYSPGEKPAEWKSHLGPVVLTRIGESDWWFEQSPDD